MRKYFPHGVSLSDGQGEKELAKAYVNNSAVTLRLTSSKLAGNDELMFISKTQIQKAVQKRRSLWSSLFQLGTRVLPKVLPVVSSVASEVLPGLVTGALSSLGSFGINKILGQGVQQGGFLILQDKMAP